MNRQAAVLTALAFAGVSLAAPQRYEMRSFVNASGAVGGVRPASAWCDAPEAVIAMTFPVGPGPHEDGPLRADLLTWKKTRPGLGTSARRPVTLGMTDAGAGQVYTPLFGGSQGQVGFLHASNVENVQDPAYRMTRVNEFRLGGTSYRCRYQPQAVFMGATARRTVIVWDNGRTATYATRNFDGTRGVYVTDGQWTGDDHGREYRFTTRDGYVHVVYFSPFSAQVRVKKGDEVLLTQEPFVAYSYSQPVKEQP